MVLSLGTLVTLVFAVSSGVASAVDTAVSGPSAVHGGLPGALEDLAHLDARDEILGDTGYGPAAAAGDAAESGSRGDPKSAGARRASVEQQVSPDFKAFVKKHRNSRAYCPGLTEGKPCVEALRRERSFLESKAIIDAHNSHADATFTLGFTPFADYTGDEFVTQRLNYKSRHSLREKRMEKRTEKQARLAAGRDGVTAVGQLGVAINASPDAFPRSFDWADVPEVMGKIHTQETSCASCWAYTSTDTIEAQVVISGRQKTHVELSAEQLINCDGYDSGCNTGNMFTAYEWIHDNGGIATARTFHAAAQVLSAARSAALTAISSAAATTPSEVSDMHSDGEQQTAAAAEVGFAFKKALGSAEEERAALDAIESSLGEASMDCPAELPLQDRVYGYCELDFEAGEAALMEAVAKNPVAIGINANKVFQLYAGGIIRASDCGPAPHTQDAEIMSINHAVIVTGWGESRVNGELMKFWVLKNSFGEGWGERGYFKLERGGHSLDEEGFGTCGMYFESVYPVLDENATAASCVPGCTFRTKYYSATAVLGAGGKALELAPENGSGGDVTAGSWRANHDHWAVMEMAALLIGGTVVGGVMVVTLSRSRGMSPVARVKQEERALLLPH